MDFDACIARLTGKDNKDAHAFTQQIVAVEPHLSENVRFVTYAFGEWKGGKVIEKGTQCKMARGQMVRWMAEHKIEDPENLRAFDQLGYRFRGGGVSAENHYVFLKQPEHPI